MSSVENLHPIPSGKSPLHHVEEVEKSAPGGYHPVDIGDIIDAGNRQYEVLHKLGYGGSSTVCILETLRAPRTQM